MPYQHLYLINSKPNFKIIWEFHGNVSPDSIAGFLAGAQCIVRSFYHKLDLTLITFLNSNKSYIPISLNQIPQLSSHLSSQNILYDELYLYHASPGHYGWWIYDPNYTRYNLFEFQTYDFVKSFIFVFKIFKIDFRNYIAGCPFVSTQNLNFFCGVDGYNILPIASKIDTNINDFFMG